MKPESINRTVYLHGPNKRIHLARQLSERYAMTLCGLHRVYRDQWANPVVKVHCRTCVRLSKKDDE